jgi:hypothetical protein
MEGKGLKAVSEKPKLLFLGVHEAEASWFQYSSGV